MCKELIVKSCDRLREKPEYTQTQLDNAVKQAKTALLDEVLESGANDLYDVINQLRENINS